MMKERREKSIQHDINSSPINDTGNKDGTNSSQIAGSDNKSQRMSLNHSSIQRSNTNTPTFKYTSANSTTSASPANHLPRERHPHLSYHHFPPSHPSDRSSNGRTSPETQCANRSVGNRASLQPLPTPTRQNSTVSRRGGRSSASSRSRSPYLGNASSVIRPSSAVADNLGIEEDNNYGGKRTPLGMNCNPQPGPSAPRYFKDRKDSCTANPSSAAATAAAAAAAIVKTPRNTRNGPPPSRYYDEHPSRYHDVYSREEYFDRQGSTIGKDGEYYDRKHRNFIAGHEGPSDSGHYSGSDGNRKGNRAHTESQHPQNSENRDDMRGSGSLTSQKRHGKSYPPYHNHHTHPSQGGNPQEYRRSERSEDVGRSPSSHHSESRSGPGPSQRAFEADYPPYSKRVRGVNDPNDYVTSRRPYNHRQDMPPPPQQQHQYRDASSGKQSSYSKFDDGRYEGDSGNVGGPSRSRPFNSSLEFGQYEGYQEPSNKLSGPRNDSPVNQFNYNRNVKGAGNDDPSQTDDRSNDRDQKYIKTTRVYDETEHYPNNRVVRTTDNQSQQQPVAHLRREIKYFDASPPKTMWSQDRQDGSFNPPAHWNTVTPSSRGEGLPPGQPTPEELCSGGSRKSRIIETSAPLHLSISNAPPLLQCSDGRNSSSSRPDGWTTNKSSVFRGTSKDDRSSDDAHRSNTPTTDHKSRKVEEKGAASSNPAAPSGDSMILALNSQAALSFEISQFSSIPTSEGEGISPEDPPKMQRTNPHHSINNNKDACWSPKSQLTLARSGSHNVTGATSHGIEMAPSFTLFNTSFDSLGDVMAGQTHTSSASAFGLDGFLNSFANSHDLGDRVNHHKGVVHNPSMGNLGAISFSSVYQNKNDSENKAGNSNGRENRSYPARCNSSIISQSGSNNVPLVNPGIMNQGSMNLTMLSSPNNSFGGGFAIQPGSSNIGASNSGCGMVMRLGDASPPPRSNSYGDAPVTSPTHSSSTCNIRHTQILTSQDRQQHPLSHTSQNSTPCDRKNQEQFSPDRSSSAFNPNTTHSTSHISPESTSSCRNENLSFYAVLMKNRDAFMQCTFILPGIRRAMERDEQGSQSESSESRHSRDVVGDIFMDTEKAAYLPSSSTHPTRKKRCRGPTQAEITTSSRRVASAICVFGGSKPRQSIFRSSVRSSEIKSYSQKQEEHKHRYDKLLPTRYIESENRLSWEFEETPPVEDVTDNETEEDDINPMQARGPDCKDGDGINRPIKKMKMEDSSNMNDNLAASDGNIKKDGDINNVATSQTNGDGTEDGISCTIIKSEEDGSTSGGDNEIDQPKMKYRCKLCGQPKQNHVCTYQQSLQRSIGIMVYPSVNAFTASEPGELAPALSEMNNFVSTPENDYSSMASPERPSPRRYMPSSSNRIFSAAGDGSSSHSSITHASPARDGVPDITPESTRSSIHPQTNPPGSAPTSLDSPRHTSYGRSKMTPSSSVPVTPRSPHHLTGATRKIDVSCPESGEGLLFVEAIDLKPEQYRIVTEKRKPTLGKFIYPSLPLPYAQRKSLSDNLFALSKEKAHLTDECAVVLREAREKDMWDLAVAELLTQVVVALHCPEDDFKFDGLRQHLLRLGIAC